MGLNVHWSIKDSTLTFFQKVLSISEICLGVEKNHFFFKCSLYDLYGHALAKNPSCPVVMKFTILVTLPWLSLQFFNLSDLYPEVPIKEMHKFFLSPYPKDATHQINWLRLDHLYNMSL